MSPHTAQVRNTPSPEPDVRDGTGRSISSSRPLLRLHPAAAAQWYPQKSHGELLDYRLVEYAQGFYAVPKLAGPVCLADDRQRSSPWTISAAALDALREEIVRRDAAGHLLHRVEELAGYEILANQERVYAFEATHSADFFRIQAVDDPHVLSANSLPALRARVLALNGRDIPGEILGQVEGYVLTRLEREVRAYPLSLQGAEHLTDADQSDAGVICGSTRAAMEQAIGNQPAFRPIEFAGWLPAFRPYGNCGNHPQFGHAAVPPAGYKFTQSPPPPIWARKQRPWRWLAALGLRSLKVGLAATRLAAVCLSQGASVRETLGFLTTRDLKSQLMLPLRNRFTFLTSVPFTLSQDPWVIEIEDLASLMYPHVHNGQTADLDIERQPGYRAVKALLETRNCRGIITHIRATHDGIAKLFRSPVITNKTVHIPMGVRVPAEWQRHDPAPTLNLLFTNSWHQFAESFYLRGGLDVLEAFSCLHRIFPELRLTLRTSLPESLDIRYRRIIDECQVVVLDKFLSNHELDRLMRSSHVFLLPSARIHIMSVLQSMAYGLVPVVSDGWGMTEYVEDRKTGLIVGGRYGKVAWNDEQNGMLREQYKPMHERDPDVTQNLVNVLSELAARPALRQELGAAARTAVQTRFNLAQWNVGLKRALDRAWTGE